jgi:hypothetical protein
MDLPRPYLMFSREEVSPPHAKAQVAWSEAVHERAGILCPEALLGAWQ